MGKCLVLHISRSRNVAKHIMLHGQVLQKADDARYLGLDISHDLSWNTQNPNVAIKVNRTLGFIRRNISTEHKSIYETAYNTLVRPQVEYASPVWSLYSVENPRDQLTRITDFIAIFSSTEDFLKYLRYTLRNYSNKVHRRVQIELFLAV